MLLLRLVICIFVSFTLFYQVLGRSYSDYNVHEGNDSDYSLSEDKCMNYDSDDDYEDSDSEEDSHNPIHPSGIKKKIKMAAGIAIPTAVGIPLGIKLIKKLKSLDDKDDKEYEDDYSSDYEHSYYYDSDLDEYDDHNYNLNDFGLGLSSLKSVLPYLLSNDKKINKNDIRDLVHTTSRKIDKHRTKGKKSLLSKLFSHSSDSRKNRPKTNEKLEILISPYNTKFNIKNKKWTDENPSVYVKDNNNEIKDFNDLPLTDQQRVLKEGLKCGKIYLCYPADNLELNEDIGEDVKVIVAKSILKSILTKYVDELFDNHANSYCVRKLLSSFGN
ncbi:uncharacterized protein LOC142328031 isoform X1 [Lycorma delicatula]|uniref:uncharacterized protein LOC142328031 isoform X1 n=2 Tax=Lycorma delicatula TaxID=130591 RepID=UPI003F511D8C